MFDFDKPENGSEKRYQERVEVWEEKTAKQNPFPQWKWYKSHHAKVKHWGWWFVHNCLAHPLIGLCPLHFAFEFHDYTSRKLNADHIGSSLRSLFEELGEEKDLDLLTQKKLEKFDEEKKNGS